MAHKHPVYDTDKHFVIDPITKKISTESPKLVLAQHSHNSERFTFEIPKEVEGHDMSLCNLVEIHYLNIDAANKSNKSADIYKVEDLQIGKDDTADIVFGSWLIDGNATHYVGNLNFAVSFACVADDGTIDYCWPTLVYSNITVGETIWNTETVVSEHSDIIAQFEARIAALEKGGATDEQIAKAVSDYLKENPVESLTEEELAAAIEAYFVENPIEGGTITEEQIAQAVEDYFAEHPIESPKVDLTGVVKSVNGNTPDENGNVEITIPDSGGNADYAGVEPAYEDIPKVFFGGQLQQTKDEAVVPFRYISKTDDFSGYAVIKAQGHGSLNYPKKNQNVKMFKDAECTEKLKVDFKGWGKQNKHCYKANWQDLTHARNIVSARLWGDVVKSRINYAELPELLRTSPNYGAIDGFPVKLYADGVYQGRYTLNIPKDKWAFNMDDDLDEHCVLYSENCGSGNFRATAKIDGTDWTDEVHDVVPESIKTRWNEVISFVMHSTDEDFRANLDEYFFVDSLIDYYLYALAICGLDSLGRNQIFATYDGYRWIASAYDLDSTWGMRWDGTFVSASFGRNEFEDMLGGGGNLLYIRLEQLFYEELQTRWAELKNGALSIVNIINRFERFTDIAPIELVKEDYASTTGGGKFTGIPSKDINNIQQIRAFALERQAWTDKYVSALTGGGAQPEPDEPDEPDIPDTSIPCTGIILDKSNLTFDGEGTQTITATVMPSDTTDSVVWVSSAPDVAYISVEGNVCTVQSVSNGDAVIAVTCGNQSASCNVTVSGFVLIYGQNVFDGLEWLKNTSIDKNTGELKTVNGEYATAEKAELYPGYVYKMANGSGGRYPGFAFFDANDVFKTYMEDVLIDFCIGNQMKTLAKVYSGGATITPENLTIIAQDNSAKATEYKKLVLAEMDWTVTSNGGIECAFTGVPSVIHSVETNIDIFFLGYITKTIPNVDSFAIYNGNTLIYKGTKTESEFRAYLAESNPTIEFNPHLNA